MKALFLSHFKVPSSERRASLEYEIAREVLDRHLRITSLGSGEQGALLGFPSKKRRFSSVLSYITKHNFLFFIVMHLCSSEVFSYLE